MVIKIGIDQIQRFAWKFGRNGEGWVSMDYANDKPPKDIEKVMMADNKYIFGFNDFVIVECTPEMAYQIHGVRESDVQLPPKHPRAWMRKTPAPPPRTGIPIVGPGSFSKHKSGYTTMAYGWGLKEDIFDLNSTVNQYIDVEGPPDPEDMTGEPFVKYLALPIPQGLQRNDTFWIDLNKGVRALYFPARFVYSDDFPGDAAYAKISFVEEGSRKLIDAAELMAVNTVGKALFDIGVELGEITRKNSTTADMNNAQHLGAYSFDSTIIVNIPQFIESSYLVSTNQKAAPHDSIYLAKSADIKATRRAQTDHWMWPQDYLPWDQTLLLSRSYSAEISRVEQINLPETQTSDLGAGAEFGLNILVMAASLVPYVGPLLATVGSEGIERLKNIKVDSPPADVTAAGISSKAWNSASGELKDAFVQRLGKDLPKVLKVLKK